MIEGECGNGVVEGDEECDTDDLGDADCVQQGYTGGTLACLGDCSFDTALCVTQSCGDGQLDPGEACDGANLNGNDCTTLGLGFAGGSRC